MNERYPDRNSIDATVDHGALLKEQLESGETAHFDAGSIALLRDIATRKDQSSILQSSIDAGIVGTRSVGSKVAGVVGALGGGAAGVALTTREVSTYLSEKFTLDPADVKAIPNNTAQAVEGALSKVTESVDPDVVQASKDTAGAIGTFFRGVADRARDFVVDNGGGDALKAGNETLTTVTDAVAAGTSRGVDVAVENINTSLVQPTIDATSDTVGSLSYLPSAAIGYLLASGFVGGTAGVVEHMRHERSFAHILELISRCKETYAGEVGSENDPRVLLIAEFARSSQQGELKKLNLTQAQWLTFAAETRKAKCSLLREKTRAPEIVLDEEKTVIEKKQRVIDSIVLNRQSDLAQADRELATIILAQFEKSVAQAIDPIDAAHAQQQELSKKIVKYSGIFVRSGINATGLPTLWRGFKRSVKFVGKVLLPI